MDCCWWEALVMFHFLEGFWHQVQQLKTHPQSKHLRPRSLIASACLPLRRGWSGRWQGAVPMRPKCLPRSLTRWQGPHPPHSRLLPWLLSTQRDIFSFYLLSWMMVTPLGARAKQPLGLSCCCWTLRSVGNLPARMCCGHSRRYHTVWVTSHLLSTRQSQVSRHVPWLCQGTRAKSILAAIARQSLGEW